MRRARGLVAAVAVIALAATGAGPVRATGGERLPVARARLVSYYPSTHGWAAMWTRWNEVELDRDMGRVAALGANAVRLIVQPSAFGYPVPAPAIEAHLQTAVTVAAAHGLAVELTLFDWFGSYGDVAGSTAWARAVLAPFAGDTRLLAVELRNEVPVGDPLAVRWTRAMLPVVATAVPGTPTTVSVTGPPGDLAVLRQGLIGVTPTFWSYHWYGDGRAAEAAFRAAQLAVAPRPLFIGETGADSLPRKGETTAAAELRQAGYYADVFAAARRVGLAAPAPWTLWDFVAGSVPGRYRANQYAFGLLRLDGSAKPAAAVVRAAFTASP